ncbi:hypothetical protein F0919_09435 [Taibaiella lutea]|uniref:Uncharacterized protein n=1 Tax=Taibaiella lutea TaxID=2608001 RepID=A0A5M6CK60_9BACT|nr:hypothetical protein [Taibaiella lutea]KAA5534820.1 hypothetical protein F0919_09435 [Taibaiella lutea]
MKKILQAGVIVLCATISMTACKKDKEEKPDETGLYYFNFKGNETAYNFNSDLPKYLDDNMNQIGGFQMSNNTNKPNISLAIKYDHNPTEAEVLDLAGKTFYFDGSFPGPVVTFDGGAMSGAEKYHSVDTLASAYNVKVNGISYKKTDTINTTIVDVYVINGTCKAYLENDQDANLHLNVTEGSFNFLVSRIK